MRIFKEKKNLQRQEVKLYDDPTEYTMKDRGNTVYCKCGHTVEFWTNENKVLCTHCNRFVFKTKKDEFDYRMKGMLKK